MGVNSLFDPLNAVGDVLRLLVHHKIYPLTCPCTVGDAVYLFQTP